MVISMVIAFFLAFIALVVIFSIYTCLIWYRVGASQGGINLEEGFPVKSNKKTGLPPSYLEKLPKMTGKDLVLGRDCAVCLDDIEIDQPVRLVPGCNHGFHLQCVDTWLSKNSICPVCRAKLPPVTFDAPDAPSLNVTVD